MTIKNPNAIYYHSMRRHSVDQNAHAGKRINWASDRGPIAQPMALGVIPKKHHGGASGDVDRQATRLIRLNESSHLWRPLMLTVQQKSDEFDDLRVPAQPRVVLRRAGTHDFEAVSSLLRTHLDGPIASRATVRRILSINANSLMLMTGGTGVQGLWGMLMLRASGLEALLGGEFDALDPPSCQLADCAEGPAAIYVWILVCPGVAAEGICHMAQFLRQPFYRYANLYSRPTTPAGMTINLRRGFRPIGDPSLGLLRYVRAANRPLARQSAA